jgi:hypothetical protein
LIAAAAGVMLYLLFGGVTAAFSVISFIGLGAIYFLTRGLKGEREKLRRYRFSAFGIYFALLAYGYGITTAYSDLAKSDDVYAIDQKDSQGAARHLVLLRIFDKGLLVRDLPAQRVEFLRWDSISSMSRSLPTPSRTKGYLCTWFDLACRGAKDAFEP